MQLPDPSNRHLSLKAKRTCSSLEHHEGGPQTDQDEKPADGDIVLSNLVSLVLDTHNTYWWAKCEKGVLEKTYIGYSDYVYVTAKVCGLKIDFGFLTENVFRFKGYWGVMLIQSVCTESRGIGMDHKPPNRRSSTLFTLSNGYYQGCHGQGKVRENVFFFQGQGKVREFCIKSGKF